MFLFYLLIGLFTILITFTVIATIIKVALIITIRYDYDYKLLIVPSIITTLVWSIVGIGWKLAINYFCKEGVLSVLTKIIFTPYNLENELIYILLVSVLCVIVGIFLQSLSYFTINIDYKKIFGNIRLFVKKIFKVNLKEEENVGISVYEKPDNLSFGSALVASLFTFTAIFFITLILLFIGTYIGNSLNY